MNIVEKIISLHGRYDNRISEFKENDFGKYVLTGFAPPKEHMIGKLVQIRLEAGAFGSDMVLLRHYDNCLVRHENQSFYFVDKEFTHELDILFKDVDKDTNKIEYTIASGEFPETGFLIASKFGPTESTPMRAIKNSLKVKIAKKLEGMVL